ncbi:carboxypeptidase-like regulatory domain-containing protein [Dyadobacter aurulentus]|uniref:carboxypeptidase-like regulatory domain-containing protein n=1 Tax=Dyadobacter sp. UC 10 TaxID=2605428 RepID=UPI0011F2CB7D|nr:carboxypeptidase-like regulatory domain-containing protein [Dyadobacter sp. UC 10]KAA0993522.1 carboxypeptidase regulatory-like domain-containing protein [Dyadobacter sp. UC 10]
MKVGLAKQIISALILLIQIGCFHAYAQTTISGKVMDERGRAIPNANIAIVNKSNTISAFTFSGDDGSFTLKAALSVDSLTIKATRLGFEAGLFALPNRTQSTQLVLKESALKLQELTVKAPPVILRKDTIDYQVSAFQAEGDRTIADVIKRMPGIEVKPNGQILYQGNPIEKYYINGLDLLEGRYNLANENLPADAVRKVQVIENDQPIKILKSKVFSEKASLNIQLKKITTTGSAKAGVGLSPALWDVNITPMIFNKSFQLIASVQSNNVGTDLSRQLDALTKSSPIPAPVLSIQSLNTPNISTDRWLDNRSHLASLNLIKKTRSQTELKLGLGIRDETQEQAGRNYTRLLTPGGVVEIDERISNRFHSKALHANLVVEKNTERIFLKNNAGAQFGQLDGSGRLSRNLLPTDQNLTTEQTQLQNNLTMIKNVGKQLLNIHSQMAYNRRPEALLVRPGVFFEIFNAGKSFQSISQNVFTAEFDTRNSVSFTRQFSKVSVTPAIGLNFQNHLFESAIKTAANDSTQTHSNAFQNDLKYAHLTSFAQLGSYYESKKWQLELNLPLRMHAFSLTNFIGDDRQKQSRLAFEPSVTTRYQATDYIDFTSGASYSYDFGNPPQLYSGFLLRSYRNLQKTNGAIPVNRILMGRIGINYKNPLSLVFFNLAGSVLRINNNLQYRTGIDSTGASQLTYVLNNNIQLSENFHLGVGKYFGGIKTSFKLNSDFGFTRSEQIVTGREVQVRNWNYRVGLSASTLFTTYLGIELAGTANFFQNGLAEQRKKTSGISQLQLGIDIYPDDAHALRLDTEQYVTRGGVRQNQFYLNLRYRYTFGKRKIDLEIKGTNLTNAKNYLSIVNTAFTIAESSFQVRPRQLTFGVRFPF